MIFKGLSVAKNCLRPENAPLTLQRDMKNLKLAVLTVEIPFKSLRTNLLMSSAFIRLQVVLGEKLTIFL